MKSNKVVLEVKYLTKDYVDNTGYKIRLFEDLSFTIHENEFTVILAPYGSGKSTLLKILSGTETGFEGEIIKSDERISALIADTPTSLQWKSVKENIKFTAKDVSEREIQKAIDAVGLTGYEDFSPHPKSYGFRLRIELARALAKNPLIVLIDDALDNINDEKTRFELLLKLRELNKIYDKTTFLFATNNLTDGLFASDKLLLMSKHPGKIIERYEISFPEERDASLIDSEEFLELRNSILIKYKDANDKFLTVKV